MANDKQAPRYLQSDVDELLANAGSEEMKEMIRKVVRELDDPPHKFVRMGGLLGANGKCRVCTKTEQECVGAKGDD